jgi:hypothetical protein
MRLPGGAAFAHAVLRHDDARRTAAAASRACRGRGHLVCVAAFVAPESLFVVSSLAASYMSSGRVRPSAGDM